MIVATEFVTTPEKIAMSILKRLPRICPMIRALLEVAEEYEGLSPLYSLFAPVWESVVF